MYETWKEKEYQSHHSFWLKYICIVEFQKIVIIVFGQPFCWDFLLCFGPVIWYPDLPLLVLVIVLCMFYL